VLGCMSLIKRCKYQVLRNGHCMDIAAWAAGGRGPRLRCNMPLTRMLQGVLYCTCLPFLTAKLHASRGFPRELLSHQPCYLGGGRWGPLSQVAKCVLSFRLVSNV
jgi:hypothetical protein